MTRYIPTDDRNLGRVAKTLKFGFITKLYNDLGTIKCQSTAI